MAKKKKDDTLQYLQMPLPSGGKYSKMTKVSFGGLNKRHTHDSGSLSMESNISTNEYPYLTPSEKRNTYSINFYKNPLSMFAFDDFVIVIYRDDNGHVYVDYIKETKSENTSKKETYTATMWDSDKIITAQSYNDMTNTEFGGYYFVKDEETYYVYKDDEWQKIYPGTSVVQFNVYDVPTDTLDGKYVKKLLIFPDKKSMDFDITEGNFPISDMLYTPNIKYATVHLSRVFGVDDDRVYASGFNDYSNWNLDTVEEYNESNAWCSPSQSNTKAGGRFTGITTFQNHVVCFKRDFMHEIYNTKNPFRIQDIYAEGAIDNRTIQDVDGKLIFVSEDDVKIYTGSNPRIIGYNLNMPRYTYAVSGTDNRNYYLYCEDDYGKRYLYVYDTMTDLWSEQSVDSRVLNFAHNKNGMFMLCEDGFIYKMDTGSHDHEWSFETELITNQTVNIKHIKKLQMLADLDEGAELRVYILYDDINELHPVYSNTKTGKLPIRVKPRKTANYGFKLHFEGKGYVKLYELEIFLEAGGDMYV